VSKKLNDLFGFGDKPDDFDMSDVGGEGSTEKPAPPNRALKSDKWGDRQGDSLWDNALLRMQLEGQGIDEHTGRHLLADFFGSLFERKPELNESCVDTARHEYVTELFDSPDFKALRAGTAGRRLQSEIAIGDLLEGYLKWLDDRKGDDAADGKPTEPKHWSEMPEPEKSDGEKAMENKASAVAAIGASVEKAADEVDRCEESMRAVGMGAGGPGEELSAEELAKQFRAVRDNHGLRKILELAGAFRRVAQARQKTKLFKGIGPSEDFKLGGIEELDEVLDEELALMLNPKTKADFLQRLSNEELLCLDSVIKEPAGRGPILVTVDESSSMISKDNILRAKALALALAWVADHQGRWCGLIAYSGDTGERLLSLPPGRWPSLELHKWLSEFIGGGSDIDVPVRELPRMYDQIGAPVGKTDVVMITDAICDVPDEDCEAFKRWKEKASVKATAIVVGQRGGSLEDVCDTVHYVPAGIDVTDQAICDVFEI